MKKRIVIGVTGASGIIYAIDLIQRTKLIQRSRRMGLLVIGQSKI